MEGIDIYSGERWGLVAKLLEILKNLTVGAYRGSLAPAATAGVAPHPVAIFRKSSPLEPRSARTVSMHVRDTLLGLERAKGRGGPRGKTETDPQTRHLSLVKGERCVSGSLGQHVRDVLVRVPQL